MRRVIVAAFVLATVAALLPLLAGLSLQARQQQLLAELAGRGYRVTESDYRLGWLHSSMQTEIAPAARAGDDPSRLRLRLRLQHGPRAWLRAWPPTLATAGGRASLLGGPRALPPLVISARLHVTGGLDARLNIPDVAYSGSAGRLHLSSGGAQLWLPRTGPWQLSGQLGATEAAALDGRGLRLEDIGWALAAADADAAWPLSRLHIALGALHLDASGLQPAVDLGSLALTLDAEQTQGTFDLSLDAAVDAVTVGLDSYAPSALSLAVQGIDAAALRQLRTRLAALDRAGLSASQQGMASVRLLLATLPQLLSGSPEAQLARLRLTTPHGEVAASAELAMAPMPMKEGGTATITAPGQTAAAVLTPLLRRLSATAEVSLPQSLVTALLAQQQTRRVRRELRLLGEPADRLPPALAVDVDAAAQAATAALQREGWLASERGQLVARLQLADARLRVNGKAVAQPSWLGVPDWR